MSNQDKPQVPSKDLESALELGDAVHKPERNSNEHHDANGGYIPREHQGMAVAVIVGFVVTFLADFAAREAHDAYEQSQLPILPADKNVTAESYRLMFVMNMIHGCMYIPCCLCLLAPSFTGLNTMFISLFWDRKYLVQADSPGRMFERQMACMFLGLCIAQLVQPTNPGVTLCALIMNCCCFLNFTAAVVFDYYRGIVNRGMVWSGFLIAPIVFIATFTVALNRVYFFNSTENPWKDDSKGDDQSMLFYVNIIYGLNFLPIALMNINRDGEKFFLSYFFEGEAIQERTPVNWVSRNCALGFTGLSIAMITAPQNTGVAVVGFFTCLLMIPLFVMGLTGQIKQVKNKLLWLWFTIATVAFCVLFAVSLKKQHFSYDTSPWNLSDE
jgi:hypothetical protein